MVKYAHYKLLFYAEEGVLRPSSLSRKLGIHINTVKKYLKLLENEGLVEAMGVETYTITSRGQEFVESVGNASKGAETKYIVIDPMSNQPIPLMFSNYEQLYVIIRYGLAPRSVLEEHLKKGYLIKWLEESIRDKYLARVIRENKVKNLDDLMSYLEKIINTIHELGKQ